MKEALQALQRYFQLTQEPNEDGTINENLEWDKGYQAAMSIIKGQLDSGKITEDDYFIEYGKQQERVRILDALNESDIDTITIHRIRKIIKEQS